MCIFSEKLNSMLSLCVMCCRNNCGICCHCFFVFCFFIISHWTGKKHWGVRHLPSGQLIPRTIWGSEHDVVWWQWTTITTAEKNRFPFKESFHLLPETPLPLSFSLSVHYLWCHWFKKNAHSLNYQETQVNKWQNVKRTLWPHATH